MSNIDSDSNSVMSEVPGKESSLPTTRRNLFKFVGVGAAVAVMSAATSEARAAVTPSAIYGLANVKDFGALGDGITSDQAAFQAAMDYAASYKWGGIYVPPGRYLLSAPVQVPGSMTIQGVGGLDYGGDQGTVLLPVTVAFMPKSTNYQQADVGFVCKNIIFFGGTIPIDLGFRHECIFRDLTFINPSVAAISIVLGERHEFTNIRVYSQTTNCQYGLALASPTITTIPGLSTANYGSEGAWVDRVSVDKLAFIHGPSAYVQNAIYCSGTLSNFNSQHIVCQGIRGYVLYVGTRLQFSHITNITMDGCNTSGALVYINWSLQNVLTDVSPSSAGNNVYNTGVKIIFSAYTVLINCAATGDNASRYGFWFDQGVGQIITLIGCHGALYLNSPSRLQQNRITQIACSWTVSSTEGSAGLSSTDNRHIILQLMADSNGALPSTASVKIVGATTGGNNWTILDASLAGVAIGGGAWNYMPVQFGSRYEWYDAMGNKRAKRGAPTRDDDGVIISVRPVV